MQNLRGAQQAFRWEESALAAARRRDFPHAIGDFRQAIALFPGYAPFYAHLAFVQLKSGEFYPAQATARKAQQLAPDLFLCQSVAGLVHFAAGDYPNALQSFRAADRLVEGVRTIRFYLAECYFKLGDNRRAVPLYGDLAQNAPNTPEGQVALQRLQRIGAVR